MSINDITMLIFVIDYVEEIFQTYLMASKDELNDAANKLREMNPAPMNSMLEKQPKQDAIKKRDKRRSMVVADVPPTTPGTRFISKQLLLFFFFFFSVLCRSICELVSKYQTLTRDPSVHQ